MLKLNTQPQDRLRLVIVGDIMLFGRYNELLEQGKAAAVFAEVTPVLRQADVVVGNLECVLTASGLPRDDKLCLQANPHYAAVLREAGFTHLSLANNHSFDFGETGYRHTTEVLRSVGIAPFGAGDDLEASTRPVFFEKAGVQIALLAACDESTKPGAQAGEAQVGAAPLQPDRLRAQVRSLSECVDHVVVVLHWGFEYSAYPTPEQAQLARQLIDDGARLVLGHHSHMIQGIEHYREGLIVYSLGNFTDADVDWIGPKRRYQSEVTQADRELLLLAVELDKQGMAEFATRVLWLDDTGRPAIPESAVAARIQAKLEQRSNGLEPEALKAYWEQSVIENRVLGPVIAWWQAGSLLDKIKRFNLGQIKSLYLVVAMFLQVKLSKSQTRWSLLNPRNDERPMPAVRERERE